MVDTSWAANVVSFSFMWHPLHVCVFCPVRPSLYVCLLLVDLANLCLSLSVAKGLSDCVYVIMRECVVLQVHVQLSQLYMRLLLKSSTCIHSPSRSMKACGKHSIAVWLVIVLSSVSPMSLLLNLHNVASSGVPLHRGKWQHFPMFCLSVCLFVCPCAACRLCSHCTSLSLNVCRAYVFFFSKSCLLQSLAPYRLCPSSNNKNYM